MKSTYLTRRVDFFIDALLLIEQDNFFAYMQCKQPFQINYLAIQEPERYTHEMKFSPEMVQVTHNMYQGHKGATYSMIAHPPPQVPPPKLKGIMVRLGP